MAESSVVLVVGANCTEAGRAAEFARWYREVHIPEVMQVRGMLGATIYENLDAGDKEGPCFLTVWELENEQTVQAFKDHLRRQRKKEIPDFTWGPKFELKLFKFFRKRAGPESE
ncbi:MAG: DUF4286 family protein [Chloroflexi bacterium]|nr:DUF4286 family protein [Chloroflexota bacterium]